MAADNQQERLDDGFRHYISGFVDGEGTFHVAIQKTSNVRVGYQLIPEFRISQRSDRVGLLEKFSIIVERMTEGKHLGFKGLQNLLEIVFSMNRKGQYRTVHKPSMIHHLESSETIRQNSATRGKR